MPSSPFATIISMEHLCYENSVKTHLQATDYDVDKCSITRSTSTVGKMLHLYGQIKI
jgi:hypothetical protein